MHWSTLKEVRIAHIADCHLRNAQYGSAVRGLKFLEGLKSAIAECARNNVQYIICAGDMLDSNNPGPAVVNWQLAEVHSYLKELDLAMIVTVGNHDNCSPSWLTPYEYVGNSDIMEPGLHLLRTPGVQLDYDTWPCCINVGAIEYCSKEEFLEESSRIQRHNGEQDILIWHGEIQEFCGFPNPNAIRLDEIPKGLCQVLAMGHIHVHKHVWLGTDTVVAYPGSTEMASEDEEDQKKLYVYTFTGDDSRIAKLTNVESLPFETQKVMRCTIKTEEDLVEAVERIKKGSNMLCYIRYEKTLHDAVQRLTEAVSDADTLLRLTPMMPDRFNVHTMSREAVVRGPAEFFEANAEDLIHDPDVRNRVSGLCKTLLTPGTNVREALNEFCDERLQTVTL